MSDDKPLEGRIALVTGASRGIGYEAALGLAKAGAHVIALARTVGGLDDDINFAGGSATLVPLDITDFEAIDRLGASINDRWGHLDILVGNAGTLGVLTPLAQNKPSIFDEVFAVNVTANYRLLRSMDPLLQASDAGRAIFLTSVAARTAPAFVGPYSASKSALETLVRTYAKENRLSSVNANLVDPGTLRTKMRAQYNPGENPDDVTSAKELVPVLVTLSAPQLQENGRIYDFSNHRWLAEPAE